MPRTWELQINNLSNSGAFRQYLSRPETAIRQYLSRTGTAFQQYLSRPETAFRQYLSRLETAFERNCLAAHVQVINLRFQRSQSVTDSRPVGSILTKSPFFLDLPSLCVYNLKSWLGKHIYSLVIRDYVREMPVICNIRWIFFRKDHLSLTFLWR